MDRTLGDITKSPCQPKVTKLQSKIIEYLYSIYRYKFRPTNISWMRETQSSTGGKSAHAAGKGHIYI